ncbi:Ent5p NDAI_0J00930 [Naumovozyma dairenensis CBS 421]|uniref:ENTH domain-containing protein n=1 Tax=Naumovozyma dairenensis (strain ATCC 10597 / BCRC 20456 / CBS 421 / NBRC 0211 / NRRL Y-12639) TaxID=1071378 RepID=G0WGQ7_NAUDC|nr:hypothetical protein NDAI_0J00930 [Naumovozyma dairenensis CBS 421]CCD26985.1 hypothetical protein NDAI_0J00930 [Naumovozyma dairenensis CBS 421]
MDSLSKKIQNLGIHDIRNAARFAQNVIVQYEPYQVDIRRATNTDAWGPTPKHLQKVLRNRYQVPLYLMVEYTLKRLVDHIAVKPKNFYERARKEYVNYGAEWRVVLKCLTVVEYLMLNVDDGDELNQVVRCLDTHKHILTREIPMYKVGFSNDGKMEIHERGIRKKGEDILQYLEDPSFLKQERLKNKKNAMKIRQQSNAVISQAANISAPSGTSYNANDMDQNAFGDDGDYDEEHETGKDFEFDLESEANIGQRPPQRQLSAREEQRKQRREILRQRIKNSEQQHKQQTARHSTAAKKTNPVPDLLDFDDLEPASPSNKTDTIVKDKAEAGDEDEDDEFGDFQSDASPSPAINKPVGTTASTNTSSNLDDLLDFGSSSNSTTSKQNTTITSSSNTTNKNNGQKDAFEDLFSYSKSLI